MTFLSFNKFLLVHLAPPTFIVSIPKCRTRAEKCLESVGVQQVSDTGTWPLTKCSCYINAP